MSNNIILIQLTYNYPTKWFSKGNTITIHLVILVHVPFFRIWYAFRQLNSLRSCSRSKFLKYSKQTFHSKVSPLKFQILKSLFAFLTNIIIQTRNSRHSFWTKEIQNTGILLSSIIFRIWEHWRSAWKFWRRWR